MLLLWGDNMLAWPNSFVFNLFLRGEKNRQTNGFLPSEKAHRWRLKHHLVKLSHTTRFPPLDSVAGFCIWFKTLTCVYKNKTRTTPTKLKALVTPHDAPWSLLSSSTAQLAPPSLSVQRNLASRFFSVMARTVGGEMNFPEKSAEPNRWR